MTQAGLTDPILELVATLRDLRFSVDRRGYDALSEKFGVEPGSSDFALIISLILKRMEHVSDLIMAIDEVDDVVKERQVTCISNLRRAFSPATLTHNWKTNGGGPEMLAEQFLVGVEALQSHARKVQPIPKLTDEELEQLLLRVSECRQKLEELQHNDSDFVRQSLIDGIKSFELSLTHFKWLGWDNAFKSFEQAFLLYLIEEHGMDPSKSGNSKHAEVFKEAGVWIRQFWQIARRAKEHKEVLDFISDTFDSGTKLLGGG